MDGEPLPVIKSSQSPALHFQVHAEWNKARASTLILPHYAARAPMFMPVGTQASVKGLTPAQMLDAGAQIVLANTYHLALRPGGDIVEANGGIHEFMCWPRGVLTDSGGFQMVSLVDFSEVTEEGVKFRSVVDGSEIMLTPERSIQIQNQIGADIIMALDDVISSTTVGPRVEEATHRTLRWIDRCISAHENKNSQNLFGIVQGGLDTRLRQICLEGLIKRDLPGYAIGGLSGGEEKDKFWRMVDICTDYLPQDKPRYCMGVGYPVDLVCCVALGVDMFDCVYPARTARFGTALVSSGTLKLKSAAMATDFRPVDETCDCHTCRNYTRSYIHLQTSREGTVGSQLLTLHNIHFLVNLMRKAREAILQGAFPEFVQSFMLQQYPSKEYPRWVIECLDRAGINLV